jgi:hypothetical protein
MKIFSKSSDYRHIYKDNKSCDFRIEVLRETKFDSNAQVTLKHLIVPPIEENKVCYILCSICAYSQCSEVYRRVLRVVQLFASKSAQQIFLEPQESFALNQNFFQEIRFSFKDEKDLFIKFEDGYETFLGIEIK